MSEHDAPTRERDDDRDRDRDDRRDDDRRDNHRRDDDGRDKEGRDKEGRDKEKKNGDKQPEKKRSRWPIIIAVIVLLLAVIAGTYYWWSTRNEESTDDAYTEGNAVSIAPKVSGYVTDLRITDNSVVKAGDLLLKIDPRDYITARDQARANLALAEAQLSSAQTDLEITRVRAPASLEQARAQLAQARASQAQAQRDFQRQRSVDPRATTQTNVDQAATQLRSNSASVNSAEAQVSIASLVQQNIQAAEDTVAQRRAQVDQARANLAQAELNLSYTELRAPQDGRVTRRNVDQGTYAQAGQQVFYLVTNDVWVTANFKETQLNRMRLGQHVDIGVDAYPGLKLSGHIESIQGGSGARFSTFPAENATGNFVKIVRRVPVKILIDHGLEDWHFLPLGLSVEPTVQLK
jgi:membrane fusion protein, multidrug efflux system